MLTNRILLRKQFGLAKLAARGFSGGHGHDHGHHDDHHDHHDDHGHGHGHHVELPDKNFHYMALKDKKYLALYGLKPTKLAVDRFDNPFKHLNDMNMFNSEIIVSSHAGGHLTHEEELLHDEPYGYIRGDDPYEAHGRADQPLLYMAMGIVMFIHFTYTHFNFSREKQSQVHLHQRITAGMLEDRIREIREEDYQIRYGQE